MRKFAVSLLIVGFLLVIAMPAFADEIEVTNKGADSLAIGGYLRFVGWIQDNDEGTFKNDDSFRQRHTRIAVKGKLPNNFSFKIQGDFSPDKVQLKDGWLKWNNDENTFYIMGGQIKVPFSMSQTTSSSKRWPINRPMVAEAIPPSRQIGMMTGGNFDTETDWHWSLGVWNGNGAWSGAKTDNNDPFTASARLEYGDMSDFLIGVDAYGGAQGGGSSSSERYDLLQIGVHVNVMWDESNDDEVSEWNFGAEYLHSEMDPIGDYEDDEVQSDGWWAELGYWFNDRWHGHVMVDQYDPNDDVEDDEYIDFTVGFSHAWMGWLDPHHEKVTFQYVHHDESDEDFDDDELWGLWQLKY